MRISIANISEHIEDGEFKSVVHAIERQVQEDFAPLWGMNAAIRMIDGLDRKTKPNPEINLSDVVIYVGEANDDGSGVQDALGYHSGNHAGVPYGFVFTDIAAKAREPWSVTLSHEVLELIADPEVNLMVMAPHPRYPSKTVLRPYEVCDPVQGDTYKIDGVAVSNFVTPLYFATLNHPLHTKTNYLNLKLERFGVRPDGYYSYLDLATGNYENEFGNREKGPKSAELKKAMGSARRQARRIEALEHFLHHRS